MGKAKFIYNNAVNSSIKINPFKAFTAIKTGFKAKIYKEKVPAVTNYLNNLKKTKVKFKIEFSRAKNWQKKYYNKKYILKTFKAGD